MLRNSPRFYTNILRTSMILLVDFTVILASSSLTFRLCCLRTKRPTKTVSAVFGFYLREGIVYIYNFILSFSRQLRLFFAEFLRFCFLKLYEKKIKLKVSLSLGLDFVWVVGRF